MLFRAIRGALMLAGIVALGTYALVCVLVPFESQKIWTAVMIDAIRLNRPVAPVALTVFEQSRAAVEKRISELRIVFSAEALREIQNSQARTLTQVSALRDEARPLAHMLDRIRIELAAAEKEIGVNSPHGDIQNQLKSAQARLADLTVKAGNLESARRDLTALENSHATLRERVSQLSNPEAGVLAHMKRIYDDIKASEKSVLALEDGVVGVRGTLTQQLKWAQESLEALTGRIGVVEKSGVAIEQTISDHAALATRLKPLSDPQTGAVAEMKRLIDLIKPTEAVLVTLESGVPGVSGTLRKQLDVAAADHKRYSDRATSLEHMLAKLVEKQGEYALLKVRVDRLKDPFTGIVGKGSAVFDLHKQIEADLAEIEKSKRSGPSKRVEDIGRMYSTDLTRILDFEKRAGR